MRNPRLAAAALGAALAACGTKHAASPGLLLSEPSAVAVFRGLTPKFADLHPYLAIANSASNDVTIVDAVDDSLVRAPVPLRNLVVPVPDRPAQLASAGLGDAKPDLLVAVSAGGSELQVIRTWSQALGVADCQAPGEPPAVPPLPACVTLPGDVIAMVALPSPGAGTARLAVALSGGELVTVTFPRSTAAGRENEIDLAGVVVQSTALGFQAVSLAALPGDGARIFAATPDRNGVVTIGIEVGTGVPTPGVVLDALAPTRLVAAARLAERGVGQPVVDPLVDPLNWATTAPVERVYAVLDEAGCGLDAPIACGLVALDANGAGLASDFVNAAAPRAPIPIPGRALALAASGPPEFAPSDAAADQKYAPPFMRIVTGQGPRVSTGVAGVASSDGTIYWVDLGRWEIPSDHLVHTSVGVTKATADRAPGSAVDQWLVLFDPNTGGTISHAALDPAHLGSAVTVTPGFTPTVRWTVTHEGVLPGLASRRAESGDAGGVPWLALQVGIPGASEVVHLYDPTLGVQGGDTVVIEATSLGTCAAPFEAKVDPAVPFVVPDANRPGGAVRLAPKGDPAHPEHDACVDVLRNPPQAASLRATFRAGGSSPYVLVRGTGAASVHVGRPSLNSAFEVTAADEAAFGACTLPPRVAWPGTAPCEGACRTACQDLLKARLGRRVGYVPEGCGTDDACKARWPGPSGVTDVFGPALRLTIALETGAAAPRDLALVIDTREGRTASRAVDPGGNAVDARSAVVLDRSSYRNLHGGINPGAQAAGVRFLVPYASGVVLDATPTGAGNGALR